MSGLASMFVVNKGDMPELIESAVPTADKGGLLGRFRKPKRDFAQLLAERGREVPFDYQWSGYCFVYLLTYLEEKGVPLLTSEYDDYTPPAFGELDVSVIPITPAHKAYLLQLDPADIDLVEVGQYFTTNYGVGDIGGEASQDALVIIREQLATLGQYEVLLLVVR